MMTDPIADMLTRIRNAGQASAQMGGHARVQEERSRSRACSSRAISCTPTRCFEDGRFGVLRIYLKYSRRPTR